jgi:YegS/Rv2252/BmrU family lipid kinase
MEAGKSAGEGGAATPEAVAPSGEERAPREGVLIVNTKARHGQTWYAKAQESLRAQGVRLTAAHALQDPSRLPDLVAESVRDGAKLMIVGGGDGSFRSIVGQLANTDVTLGVLPLGTVNDFARNLGIEAEVGAACRVIAEGYVTRIDLGLANEHAFVITASLGFSAQTQDALSPHLKKAFGPFGYAVAGAMALRRLRDLQLVLHSEQGEERVEAVQAGVINGHSWMGGAFEIPGVDLESGRLAFYAVPPQGGLMFLRLLVSLLRGRFFHAPGLRAFTTRDMTLQTPAPRRLVIDGDLCGETPVRFRIRHDALRVCVPAGFEKA